MVELGNIEMSIGKMRDDNPENNYIYLTVTDTHGATVNFGDEEIFYFLKQVEDRIKPIFDELRKPEVPIKCFLYKMNGKFNFEKTVYVPMSVEAFKTPAYVEEVMRESKLLRDNYVSGLTTNGVPFLLTPTGLADYIKR
jgi:hypothetical protein